MTVTTNKQCNTINQNTKKTYISLIWSLDKTKNQTTKRNKTKPDSRLVSSWRKEGMEIGEQSQKPAV